MAKFCCVCSESKETPDNQLFCCKGHGCDVTVHQACYGIVSIPSGLWFCRKCESQERAARVRCELCPRKEGALKRTDSGGWAHVVCALYIPEVTFGNNVRMEPIITSKLPRERFAKSCYLCEDQGLETQAGHGACMACHKSGCRLAFHVTCAQKERLLCEEEDSRDTRNIIYCGYCMIHFKKMIRQKYKQTLRKQPPTPTSLTAPPLPPTPTAPTAVTPGTPTSTHPQLPSLPATKEPADERREAPKPIKKEKQKADLPQKRTSMDAPIPPPKRKRPRKVSSSNESTTSEAPSHTSDTQHPLAPPNINVPASPSLPVTRTVAGQALVSKASKEVPESGSNESLLSSSKDVPSASLLPPHPLSPVSAALGLPVSSGGGPFSMDVAATGRQTGSTSSDQSSASRAQAPPLSLHELLERQWEQTAQYILDQAGRQNNAGVMLAHLHQLQSENQRMQARIMELASQREFYIATNTRLSQTLAEQDGGRLPNGVQPPGEGIQQALQMAASSSPPSNGESTNRTLEESDTPGDADHRHPVVVVSSSLTKAAQDSLLQAHFMATSLPQRRASSSSSSSSKNTSVTTGAHKKEGSSRHHRGHQGGSQPGSHSRSSQELLQTSTAGLRLENERLSQQPGGNHEITYVTNSIQAPITTYTPLPSDRSFLDSGSGWLFNRKVSSNPRNKS